MLQTGRPQHVDLRVSVLPDQSTLQSNLPVFVERLGDGAVRAQADLQLALPESETRDIGVADCGAEVCASANVKTASMTKRSAHIFRPKAGGGDGRVADDVEAVECEILLVRSVNKTWDHSAADGLTEANADSHASGGRVRHRLVTRSI